MNPDLTKDCWELKMTIEFTSPELTELTPKITVFGVGGAGGVPAHLRQPDSFEAQRLRFDRNGGPGFNVGDRVAVQECSAGRWCAGVCPADRPPACRHLDKRSHAMVPAYSYGGTAAATVPGRVHASGAAQGAGDGG